MNNLVKILRDGRTAAILIPYKDHTVEALVDISMLPKVALIPGSWYASATNSTLRRRRDEGETDAAFYIWTQVRADGKVYTILLHRFVMVAAGETITDRIVDHRNGSTLDCRVSNLNVTNTAGNNGKMRLDDRPRCTSKTGIRGVTKTPHGKYQLHVSGIYHGQYDTPEEAHAMGQVIRRKINVQRTGRE